MSSHLANHDAMRTEVGPNRGRTAAVLLLSLVLPFAHGFATPTIKNAILTAQNRPSPFGLKTPLASSSLRMGLLDDLLSGGSSVTSESLLKLNVDYLAGLQKRVEKINGLEEAIEELDDEELAAKTGEFRERLKGGEDINGAILEEAFAVVREAAWRVLEQRHYDVQIQAGMILHDGRLAEMATGEGKTLVATLPTYLNALSSIKGGSFVITVNDYLAKRDMEKMGQVHRFLGLSVGLIQSSMDYEARKTAYRKDVTYVTNSELGFDYLRDHLALVPEDTVLPFESGEFDGFCVVDEADSVLIDEARTPLVISEQVPAPSQRYQLARQLADALEPEIHYDVDLKNKNVILNERAYKDCENALNVTSLFSPDETNTAWAPYISNAVKAKELFTKDIEYAIVKDDNGDMIGVGIIDSFTGRVLDGRRWSDGLHQSIEAKEGIPVSSQSKVIAKVTYQSLFRQFSHLSGMTGTAMSDAIEIEDTYGLRVTSVPTALPIARRDYPDVVFKARAAANRALVKEVVNVGGGEKEGRPCLIGTTSVEQSESLVNALKQYKIKAELLNAAPKNAERESEIIAQAGRAGVVTVATNMAGRGTDILLGGCPSTMSRLKTRSVLIEQGVLTSQEELDMLPPSPSDDYYPAPVTDDITQLLTEAASVLKQTFPPDKLTALELEEILTVATDTTEDPTEAPHITTLRNAIFSVKDLYKPILDAEKKLVQANGGLYVMGTNRHESSRIDLQLRGRAGRQGDPGTSRFFLSFEDDMFVVFGGDSVGNILKAFRVADDMPVEAEQVTKALDRVQGQVEEKYREIREQILDFDEVLDGQRKVIYKRRRNVLFGDGDNTIALFEKWHTQTIEDLVNGQIEDEKKGVIGDLNKVMEKIGQFFPEVGKVIEAGDLVGMDGEGVKKFLGVAVEEVFKGKLTDFEAKAKANNQKPNALARSGQYIALLSMDNAWKDHLQNMENLKEAMVLRKYQNLDPVAEYRREAFDMFKGLENSMRLNTVYSLWQSFLAPVTEEKQPQEA